MKRRELLVRTGLLIGAGALAAGCRSHLALAPLPAATNLDDWDAVRGQFNLSRNYIHMSSFFLASHPKAVRKAIEKHRNGLDENPIGYFQENAVRLEGEVLSAAADYLGVDASDIALTDSTTMGLGLLYGGLKLRKGQEILTTHHDHYATATALRLRAERDGIAVRSIALYKKLDGVSDDEIVDTFARALTPRTRVAAVTWVHSSTGLKLPIRRMADALATVNARRKEHDRVLLCVDGVHGIGVEDVTLPDLGCDFFIAGAHKWLFGPRGTGFVWGKPEAWPAASATIPTFDHEAYEIWTRAIPPKPIAPGRVMTPGGFHSFEHRWALSEAFRFHQRIGKSRVATRVHTLNWQLKDGLATLPKVTLHTPIASSLSAGIVCFEVQGKTPQETVDYLWQRRIVASVAPYATRYARLAPSLLTSPEDVERTLQEMRGLA